ncbi:MAG: DUF3883 domain-containing protein [Acidimicrobiales bacterium]|nr:DUF3883 domain-containing protein [Acidimicrobiales bacterium]
MSNADLVGEIRAANLNVYRASPARLREDVGSEAEIAHDYQGRLIYELLQNADDAMAGEQAGKIDRIKFRLTDNELLVMNSGRALTEADVRGLTSTGASSKTGTAEGGQRASIGHKGMGFKSILEITDRPEVYSSTYAFRLDANPALAEVTAVLAELGHPAPQRVPIMRFPWSIESTQRAWLDAREDGFNVLFRFPFKEGLHGEKISNLAEALLTLPATTILFLKHLEVVEIEVDTGTRSQRIRWSVRRERRQPAGWQPTDGLTGAGIYQVWIESDGVDDIWCFLLAHEDGLEIGPHRGGLNAYAWAGVDLTEVTVAALLTGGESDELPAEWRRFHVFLPTAEVSPYPLLINGAFATDLSRQEIRVLPEAEDYNRFLIESAASVLRDRLLPAVEQHGGGIRAALRLLAREQDQVTGATDSTPAGELHRAVMNALAAAPIIPTGDEPPAAIVDVAVPETFRHPTIGAELRSLFAGVAEVAGRRLPIAALCAAPYSSILLDLGAHPLSPSETAQLLASAPAEQTRLEPHESGKFSIDPVLRILEAMWKIADRSAREKLEHAVRAAPLFPVARRPDGTVERIAVGDTETFFPPRALHGTIPLQGLRFMLQDVCWGTLSPRERTEALRSQMPTWVSLFQIREFKFPDVMRVSVLPALALDAAPGQRSALANWQTLTAVCQLAGPTPSPDSPLPYGRLGSQRALFNLCRLPVPCTVDGEETWVPAYRAYFGSAWTGDASVEHLIGAAAAFDPALGLQIPVVVSPDEFVAHLEQMRGLDDVAEATDDEDSEDDEEVGVDEDDEQAAEVDARERWMAFLTWLGVNHVLRPVHFHDAEDRAKGWISTRGLERPSGWAFQTLGPIWDAYTEQLRVRIGSGDASQQDLYFYRLHDLEHLGTLCDLAASDTTCGLAIALFRHLSHNWNRLDRFSEVELAMLAPGTQPARRVEPPRADAKELKRFGEDLWMFRLRRSSFCPTAHGPRRPDLTWWRSSEVDRRFNRRDSTADMFLPVLSEAASTPPHEARRFAQAVGVRPELTPALFSLHDTKAFVDRLEMLYADRVADLPADVLRNQINPAYQHLFELLSGSATDKTHPPAELSALKQSRLLVHDGRGHHRFDIAETVLYAPRGGIRELQGIDDELWTFVLEGRPAASAPLQRLFGARNLEEVLDWNPQPDESPFDEVGLDRFRIGLREVAPYLLARLRAERSEEERAARDANRLRDFIEKVEPVRSLAASCSLDGSELVRSGERQAFVDRAGKNLVAFVRWGENPWPPDPSEAEALATAITELLEVGYFEPLLALLTAEPSGRDRLLHLAGASGNLESARQALNPGEATADEPRADEPELPAPTKGDAIDKGDSAAMPAGSPGSAAATRVRLVDLSSLTFDGDPVTEAGQPTDARPATKGQSNSKRTEPGKAGAYGGGTDLDQLNVIGMRIASIFEQRRLRRNGQEATVFDPDDPQPTDAVFDVSTPAAISAASDASLRFKQAIETLRQLGVAADVPGFDILTLDSTQSDDLGRLIELKSSGVSARTQTMTWNEWKTAGIATLRARYFLYLVGNLRADLDATPFIRAIRDPFGELVANERKDRTVKRSVQLDVLAFEQAEYQELTVRNSQHEVL